MRNENLLTTVIAISICLIICIVTIKIITIVAIKQFKRGFELRKEINKLKLDFQNEGDEESLEELKNIEEKFEKAKNIKEMNENLRKFINFLKTKN